MNFQRNLLMFGAMVAGAAALAAEEVYEKKGKDGVVEFSDQSSPGAQKIGVKPNVVHVTPVQPLEPAPDSPAAAMPEASPRGEEPVVIHRGVADDAYGVDEEGRRRRAVREEHREGGEDAVRAGERFESGKGAAHRGAHHRR